MFYYRGVFGNAVALVDTKPESLTNCEIAMTTDPESEQESLYESLFKVMRSAELINRMKEKVSVVISDDVSAFHNAAKAALGNDRRLASCAWHVMSNAKKKRGGWDEKKLFWPYQHLVVFLFFCVSSFKHRVKSILTQIDSNRFFDQIFRV